MKPLAMAAVAASAFALAGCQHGAYYSVVPLAPTDPGGSSRLEVIPEKLDGHWFERNVYGAGSGTTPDAVELVYCPLVKDGPTVCRTATIWTKGTTNLLEGDATPK